MGPQLVFESLAQSYSWITLTDPSETSQHRFVPLNEAHSPNMAKEPPPQCDPAVALGNNLFLTKCAPYTRKLAQEITFSTLQKPLSPRMMHQPAGQSEFHKRISLYIGFPLISHVQTWWCITLLTTVSGGYPLFWPQLSIIAQGKYPQQPEQQTWILK